MPSKSDPKAGQHKQENVDFLVDTFGIASPKAADLIAEDDKESDRLSSNANARQHAKDDLSDAPVPAAPESDFVTDSDEDQLKPVLRNRKG
ncbi:hypothetical protein [Devosia nitrariae]|uniref:DUF3606 domain-containing protein n=1 Tax=Devosia nitrariae TaxID=2071872 RepID=A0ABQ5W620_9HYPH|nr:hypothetical protein [Devosia nitrariae]GLQ55323.1 hypothetical protein GCM10010862_25820 [Devosia nitrariae]